MIFGAVPPRIYIASKPVDFRNYAEPVIMQSGCVHLLISSILSTYYGAAPHNVLRIIRVLSRSQATRGGRKCRSRVVIYLDAGNGWMRALLICTWMSSRCDFLTDPFPTTANNGKLRQSLSFFGKERRKIAGLTEIAIE